MPNIFYITNDVERAVIPASTSSSLGGPGPMEGVEYHVITFRNPYSEWLKQSRKSIKSKVHKVENQKSEMNIFLVGGKKTSTEELMKREEVVNYVNKFLQTKRPPLSPPLTKGGLGGVVVFKPTLEVEEYCKKMGWNLLNPFSKISEEFEEKISQITLLRSIGVPVPKHVVSTLGECNFQRLKEKIGTPLVLQFNLGHTGEGTFVIKNQKELGKLQKKFPKRPVRISEYIPGIPITVNAVVGKNIYVSSPSLQITGVPILTPNQFATVGNDWSWWSENSQQLTVNKIQKITMQVGKALKNRGFRGAFGVDFILQSTVNSQQLTNNLYVIEVNSRQPASVVYESFLQKTVNSQQSTKKVTTMELHVQCLLGKDTGKEKLPQTLEGAQIFVRAKRDGVWKKKIEPAYLHNSPHPGRLGDAQGRAGGVMKYFIFSKLNKGDSVKKNSEILRIQSREGMVEKPMRLKKEVKKVVSDILE